MSLVQFDYAEIRFHYGVDPLEPSEIRWDKHGRTVSVLDQMGPEGAKELWNKDVLWYSIDANGAPVLSHIHPSYWPYLVTIDLSCRGETGTISVAGVVLRSLGFSVLRMVASQVVGDDPTPRNAWGHISIVGYFEGLAKDFGLSIWSDPQGGTGRRRVYDKLRRRLDRMNLDLSDALVRGLSDHTGDNVRVRILPKRNGDAGLLSDVWLLGGPIPLAYKRHAGNSAHDKVYRYSEPFPEKQKAGPSFIGRCIAVEAVEHWTSFHAVTAVRLAPDLELRRVAELSDNLHGFGRRLESLEGSMLNLGRMLEGLQGMLQPKTSLRPRTPLAPVNCDQWGEFVRALDEARVDWEPSPDCHVWVHQRDMDQVYSIYSDILDPNSDVARSCSSEENRSAFERAMNQYFGLPADWQSQARKSLPRRSEDRNDGVNRV